MKSLVTLVFKEKRDKARLILPGQPACMLFYILKDPRAHGGTPYVVGWDRQYDGLNKLLVERSEEACKYADWKQRPEQEYEGEKE
jgi:hypothetical protein